MAARLFPTGGLRLVGLTLQIGRLLQEPRTLQESLHLQVRVLTERRAQIDESSSRTVVLFITV